MDYKNKSGLMTLDFYMGLKKERMGLFQIEQK